MVTYIDPRNLSPLFYVIEEIDMLDRVFRTQSCTQGPATEMERLLNEDNLGRHVGMQRDQSNNNKP